jgi:hypothetical protein
MGECRRTKFSTNFLLPEERTYVTFPWAKKLAIALGSASITWVDPRLIGTEYTDPYSSVHRSCSTELSGDLRISLLRPNNRLLLGGPLRGVVWLPGRIACIIRDKSHNPKRMPASGYATCFGVSNMAILWGRCVHSLYNRTDWISRCFNFRLGVCDDEPCPRTRVKLALAWSYSILKYDATMYVPS